MLFDPEFSDSDNEIPVAVTHSDSDSDLPDLDLEEAEKVLHSVERDPRHRIVHRRHSFVESQKTYR